MTLWPTHTLALLILLPALAEATPTHLEQREVTIARQYTQALLAGGGYHAAIEDQLADAGYPALHVIIEAFASDFSDVPHTSRTALISLLERTSRTARLPWPLLQQYSPQLATFVTTQDDLTNRLYRNLVLTADNPTAADLIVRLTPAESLHDLATGERVLQSEFNIWPDYVPPSNAIKSRAQYNAWNRYLDNRTETRPIPNLNLMQLVKIERNGAPISFKFNFPETRYRGVSSLEWGLKSKKMVNVYTALVTCNNKSIPLPETIDPEDVFIPLPDDRLRGIDPYAIAALLLKASRITTDRDLSSPLRAIWKQLPEDDPRLRYTCLEAMNTHPNGNAPIALQAIRQDTQYTDAAIGILRTDPDLAAQAIAHIFATNKAGIEPALRLARDLDLTQFFPQAQTLLSTSPDLIVRQAAMRYLQLADPPTKHALLPWLTHDDDDLRLAAIQIYLPRGKGNLSATDGIGPALTRVALTDPSMGHRQEALFTLAAWKSPQAEPVFRQILAQNPPLTTDEPTDDLYWPYRHRLIALYGLAAMNDAPATAELHALHAKNSPTVNLDILNVYRQLHLVPELTFRDLNSTEAKLVATATKLITDHGTPDQKERLHTLLHAPGWELFKHGGIDDHNILFHAGVADAHHTH